MADPMAEAPPPLPPPPKYELEKRPALGLLGRTISLIVNHHRVRFRPKIIHHYDVVIEPEPRKGSHFRVMSQAFEHNKELFGDVVPAYDGSKSFFTPNALSNQLINLEVVASEDVDGSRTRTFKVTIKHVSQINTQRMQQYLQGSIAQVPQEILQVMDLVMRQVPRRHFVERGRSFYNPRFGSKELDGCLVGNCGFYQSIRPAQQDLLTLNIDIAAMPMLKSLLLPDFISNYFRQPVSMLNSILFRNDTDGAHMRSKLRKLLKDIRVETSHTKHKYKIRRLTDVPLDVLRFDTKEGADLSVVDYFKSQYNINLQLRGFPAIEAGSKDRKRYIPIELCRICPEQPFIRALTDMQRSGLLTLTCVNPEERKKRAETISKELRSAAAPYIAKFGLEINPNLTPVSGRVLDPPKILYRSSSETPRDGTWNMRGKEILKGTKITVWTTVCFADIPRNAVEQFCNKLPQICKQYGVLMNPHPAAPIALELRGNIEGVLKHQKANAEKTSQRPLELILCVMPQRDNKHVYATVKKICELDLGIVTQCCLADHVMKCKPEYIANVILKINAKLGGQNSSLEEEQKKGLPLISNVPSMIIGADVSHSGVGESGPSICSVVASMDWPFFSKYKAIVCQQKRGSELFEHLYFETEDEQGRKETSGIFKELLLSFKQQSNQLPERILYYRDGVSDGQFEMVLNNEMGSLKKALDALGWNGNGQSQSGSSDEPLMKKAKVSQGPKITFIVAQKRHHTRFFPDLSRGCPTLKNGNMLPGTVVDATICHPRQFDFYLCSHAGIKGTSKPTHYHVLKDDNGFTADEIQKLTNDLCFTYARCTRSVSVVPACYYAHLAAKRARIWVDSEYHSDSGSVQSRGSSGLPSRTMALPPIHDRLKESMFYI